MTENFSTVAQQVMVLFLLIAVGFVLGKMRILNHEAVKSCADMVLIIVTPCVIVQSFARPFDLSMLGGLGIAALAALAIQAGAIGIAKLVFRDKDEARRRVLRFGTVFSNAGYMAIPLQQAILGDIGVFYGAAYITVFNLILWSYGLAEMSGKKQPLTDWKAVGKMALNPGVIGLLLGMLVFLLSVPFPNVLVPLPNILAAPIGHLAALNTPLPMLIIGYYLADTDLLAALKDKRSYIAISLRLIVIPVLTLIGLVACGIRGVLLVTCVIATSAPTAAATTMFATKFDQDTKLSVNLVSLSTLFSMITMPLVVGIAQMIA